MLIVDPDARIPVVMLSLQRDLDPASTSRLARRWRRCATKAWSIVGSGMSYHDLRHFRDGDGRDSEIFDAWLAKAATAPPQERNRALEFWAEAPAGRACHPREEHLMPLMVVAGAAGENIGARDFHDVIGGKTISGFRFG